MRKWLGLSIAALTLLAAAACTKQDDAEAAAAIPAASTPAAANRMVAAHQGHQPVFGLYFPEAEPPAVIDPAEAARETAAYSLNDLVFDGSMERGVDRGLPRFQQLVSGLRAAGATARTHPLVVKMQKISEDPRAAEHIGQQLNAGVSGIMFVDVDDAEELRTGLNAMRFQSEGGVRTNDVGDAPAYWGMTDAEYRELAHLWPADPNGGLIAWAVVETRDGLKNVREIAAVPGLGVLWPGAGSLRGVFSSPEPDGKPVLDEAAWENAIQKVLAACKEFHVACGYPAGDAAMLERRFKEGFSVFVTHWGEGGVQAVETGHRLSGR